MRHNEPESGNSAQSLQVGDLLIDLERLRVTRGDEVISLPRLSFDLLVALARVAPRVVGVDELMHMVWPGLIVGTDTISQRVKLLRDALGDDPKSPRYIAGLRGRGYQCIAPVSAVPKSIPVDTGHLVAQETPVEAVPMAPARRHAGRNWMLLGVALLLALAVVLRDRIWPIRAPGAAPIPIVVLPFSNPDGSEAGRVLAFGVAESVQYQLANLADLSVISWSSASGIGSEPQDIHEIAKRLNVAYVLLGSVQRDRDQLRVTARLVEVATDRIVWSLRVDQRQRDVFSIQDEIAAQVTRALSVSVSPGGQERMHGQGTRSVEAYLEFLEGQDALSTWRTHEAGIAAAHFDRALQLDPQFARALVMLARAQMRDAEYSGAANRREQVERSRTESAPLIARALALDPRLGEAYVERAHLRSFEDPVAAEQDYRKAIELTPSNARAYQRLAELLWDDRARRKEVAALLDRAHELDPLDPELDVTRAVYLFYGLAKSEEADLLLRRVLERAPKYLPALARHGEVLLEGLGRTAEAIGVLESVLELDPGSDAARGFLVRAYVEVGDLAQAQRIASGPEARPVNGVIVALARHNVAEAARLAYAAIHDGSVSGPDQWAVVEAINLDARQRMDFAMAEPAMQEVLNIHWAADEQPVLGANPGLIGDVLCYAGMLRAAGKQDRAEALLKAAEQVMDQYPAGFEVGNRWNLDARARAAALRGDAAGALAALEQRCAVSSCWESIELDPLFEPLHSDVRFQALAKSVQRRRTEARMALQSR